MQYIIDIALVAIFALIVVTSAKKGFFLTLFELGAYLVSTICAKVISASIAPTIFENFFSGAIKERITENLGSVAQADYSAKAAEVINSIPKQFDGLMQIIGIDKARIADQVSNTGLSGEKFIQNVMNTVISPAATAVLRVLIFIVISLVLSVVLRIIVKALNKVIKKLPLIGNINSGLGAVIGIIKGLLVVVLVALVVIGVSSFITSQQFIDAVNSSLIINGIKGILVSISGYSV